MKRLLTSVATVAVLSIGIWGASTLIVQADSKGKGTPGSVDDPVVTKSYVDEQIAKISGNAPNPAPSVAPTANPGTGSANNTDDSIYHQVDIIEMKPGQWLQADPGTEIIVRTGKTTAMSNTDDGIPDVTAGVDIAPGGKIENNHMLLFPREGRGIKAVQNSTEQIFVMVKGKVAWFDSNGVQLN